MTGVPGRPGYFLRQADRRDLPMLAQLDEVCFEPRERWTVPLWAGELDAADRFVCVIHDEGRVVAASTVQAVADTADLLRVMVDPGERRTGLARHLVVAGMRWAARTGATRLLLEVRHDNLGAIGLYEGLGFRAIDVRADYYGSGLDAQVMECALPAVP